MTELDFHFNVPELVPYACRLLRKAVASGAKVVVTARPETLADLDSALWTFSELDFVPHCFGDSDARLLAASPVVLAASLDTLAHQQVLLNLGLEVPAGFERFERLIEFVGIEEDERQAGRRRWKHYKDQGYSITRHDFNSK